MSYDWLRVHEGVNFIEPLLIWGSTYLIQTLLNKTKKVNTLPYSQYKYLETVYIPTKDNDRMYLL